MFRLQFQFQLELPFPLSALHFRAALRSRRDSHGIRPQLAQLCSLQFSSAFWLQLLPLRCGTASASASDANANEQRTRATIYELRCELRAEAELQLNLKL